MTRTELEQFIDREVKGLWPQWTPADAEVRAWLSALAGFDYYAVHPKMVGQSGPVFR